MSDIQRFWCHEAQNIRCVREEDYDTVKSQIAALLEELATAKRNEHNSEVAYKAAIEKQEELRAELADSEEDLDTVIHHNIDLQQRLADAERRNASLETLLKECVDCVRYGEDFDLPVTTMARIDAAINPNPEAASHDE